MAAVTRRQFHRDHVRRDRRPQGVAVLAIALSSVPAILVAIAAVPVIAVVQDIPFSYALTVGALALTVSFRVLIVTGPIRYGAMIAFFAATLPLHFAGMPLAFWALLAGVAGVGVFE